jgi:SMC interacting uncharacterized protein involved in chromosome segregation
LKKNTKAEGQLTLAGTEEGEILAQLSERVEKAVRMIQELRRERDALKAQLAEAATSQEDVERFAAERSEIRDRISNILSSLDELDSAGE